MDAKIQAELDRTDIRSMLLRGYAERLRLHETVAESKMREAIGSGYWQQVPLLNYILDFFHPQLLIDIEIDGRIHLAYPRKDQNRAWILYEDLGIYTIRFWNEDVLNNLEDCLEKLRKFSLEPTPPSKWVLTPENEERKRARVQILKQINDRIYQFDIDMLGKTRHEVHLEFAKLQPQNDIDVEILERLSLKVSHWPEEGYVRPGLQTVTARKAMAGKK